jgi:hypothetical protein
MAISKDTDHIPSLFEDIEREFQRICQALGEMKEPDRK